MKCKICGIHELTTGDFDGVCSYCRYHQKYSPPYQSGWICPKCGSVYAPSIQECYRCSNKTITSESKTDYLI